VGTSNINMKKLKFDLTLFKSLQSLEVSLYFVFIDILVLIIV